MAKAGRHGAKQRGPLQDVVIPCKIAHRHERHAGVGLALPMGRAQGTAGLMQRLGGLAARPIGFDGALEFALGADARKTQIMNNSHDNTGLSQKLFKSGRYCAIINT